MKRIAFLLTIGLALTACGSTTADTEESVITPSQDVESTDDEVAATTTVDVDPTTTDTSSEPEAGAEEPATLRFDAECRNSGEVDGVFDVTWRSSELLPLEWRSLGPTIEGVLRFESFDVAYFETNETSHEMTYSRMLDDICEVWG